MGILRQVEKGVHGPSLSGCIRDLGTQLSATIVPERAPPNFMAGGVWRSAQLALRRNLGHPSWWRT
eukprot:3638909-Pyramimonas_sp.AAC.1